MKALLTGHRGFIGSVVHSLLPDARTLQGRNLGVPQLAAQMEGLDCILHLAGGGGPKRCLAHPREAMENNVVLTLRLVQAARLAGIRRFVFASSIAVYGTIQSPPNPISEQAGPAPDDLYGSIKWACEEIVLDCPQPTILRFANVYGFGTGSHLDRGGFVNNVCRTARTTGKISLTNPGLGMDFVHVRDAARAVG